MSMVSDITDLFTTKLGTDLFDKTGQFIQGIAPIFSAGMAVYVVLLAFYYYNRGLDDAIMDLFKRIMVWLLIIALAFNAGNYSQLANVIYVMPDELSSLFGGQGTTANAVDTGMQNIDKMVVSIGKIGEGADWDDIATHLAVWGGQIIAYIAGYWLFMFAFAFYLIAKACLALTLMVGPLFIGAALFPGTRQYFMNWMGQCLNFIMTIVFFAIISFMQSEFVSGHVEKWAKDQSVWTLAKMWDIVGQMIAMTILFTLVMLSVPSIASALTGGAQADAHGRTIGRAMGGANRWVRALKVGGAAGRANRASRD